MDNGLSDGDACSPAVEEVEVIVRDLEKSDERVVAEGEEDSGDEVEGGKCSRASTERSEGLLVVEHLVRESDTPSYVEGNIDDQHYGVPSARESSVVDGAANLELGVVLLLP